MTYESIPKMPDYTWLLGEDVLFRDNSATVIAIRKQNEGLATEVVIYRGSTATGWTMTEKWAAQDRELGPVVANFDDYMGKRCSIVDIGSLMFNKKIPTFNLDWPE